MVRHAGWTLGRFGVAVRLVPSEWGAPDTWLLPRFGASASAPCNVEIRLLGFKCRSPQTGNKLHIASCIAPGDSAARHPAGPSGTLLALRWSSPASIPIPLGFLTPAINATHA